MRRSQQVDIRATLILAAGFHFLCGLARACLLPFLTIYFRRLGLGPAMTGAIMAAKHLITLLWSPLASAITRHYDKRRLVIVTSLVGTATVALLLPFVPAADPGAMVSRCNATTASVSLSTTAPPSGNLPLFSALVAKVSTTQPPLPLSNALSERWSPAANEVLNETPSSEVTSGNGSLLTPYSNRSRRSLAGEDEKEELGFLGGLKAMDVHQQLFFLLLMGVAAWELLSAPLDWAVDDGLYDYLDSVDASDRHGKGHTWGLLGAACGVAGAGILLNRLPCFLVLSGHMTRGASHFFCYAALAVPALLAASAFLPLLQPSRKRPHASELCRALRLVRGHPRALLCAATALLAGAATTSLDNFLLWAMEDAGAGELHMGVSLAAGCLSQAAFPRLAGHCFEPPIPWRVLLGGAGVLALQCLYYSFLWGPWAALPALLLDGLSVGALRWVVLAQSEDLAAGGAERAVGRVYGWLCGGLGATLGSLAGGLVAEWWGVGWLLRGVACVLGVWCACLPLLQWRMPHQRRINYSRLLAADASEASDSEMETERDWLDRALEDDKHHNNNNNNHRVRRMNL
ncbi:hypothetical protein CRUP_002796 [Coryphaenoides rupestris]|nr:hypothetical protein CRUP_002796 [Coryphaenoides rupestris]